MARPKVEETAKRSAKITVRLSKKEKERLEGAAKVSGLSTGEFIRKKLLSGHFPQAKTAALDLQTYLELKKIGVNVNQLARVANSGRFPIGITDILERLSDQQQFIIKLLLR